MTHLFLLWMQISVQENSCAVLHGVNVPYTVESEELFVTFAVQFPAGMLNRPTQNKQFLKFNKNSAKHQVVNGIAQYDS